jgi:alkylhydroperoxidase family enzyme
MDHGEGRFRLLKELGLVRACWARGSKFTHSQHCKFLRKLDSSQEKDSGVALLATLRALPVERIVLSYADDLVLGGGRSTHHDARIPSMTASRPPLMPDPGSG